MDERLHLKYSLANQQTIQC